MTNFPNRGYYRGDLQAMLADVALAAESAGVAPPAPSEPAPEPDAARPLAGHHGTWVKPPEPARDIKPTELPTPKQMGYSGDTCAQCGGSRMRHNGTCHVCEDCGSTTGCS